MKLTRSALKILNARYRAVLLHCLAAALILPSAAFADDPTTPTTLEELSALYKDTPLTSSYIYEGDDSRNADGTFSSTGKSASNIVVMGNGTEDTNYSLTLKYNWGFEKTNTFTNLRLIGDDDKIQIKNDATFSLSSSSADFSEVVGSGTLNIDENSTFTAKSVSVGTVNNGGTLKIVSNSTFGNSSGAGSINPYNDGTNDIMGTVVVKGSAVGVTATFQGSVNNNFFAENGTTSFTVVGSLSGDWLKVSNTATFNNAGKVSSTQITVGVSANFENSGTIKLSDSFVNRGTFTSSNGTLVFENADARFTNSGTLSGATNLQFNSDYTWANLPDFSVKKVTIADGMTLSVGANTIGATGTVSGGTIKVTLPSEAVTTTIVGTMSNTTLILDLSNVGKSATQYVLAEGVSANTVLEWTSSNSKQKYAISSSEFTKRQSREIAKSNPTSLTYGTLWISRVLGSGELAVEELDDDGTYPPSDKDRETANIIDEVNNSDINDALDNASLKDKKQILNELGLPTDNVKIAHTTVRSVLDTVFSRLGESAAAPRYNTYRSRYGYTRGRNGGEYVAGVTNVWVRGLINKSKLDRTDNAFDADISGFAAGIEKNVSDSLKLGGGYAYTSADVDSDRSEMDVVTHSGFLYGRYKPESFYINAAASLNHSSYDEKTKLLKLKSSYEADTAAAQISAGYDTGFLIPEASARFMSVIMSEYKPWGDLTVKKKVMNSATAVAGLKIGKTFYLRANKKISFRPEIKAMAAYDLIRADEDRTAIVSNTLMTLDGDPLPRFGGEFGADCFLAFGQNEIVFSYDGRIKNKWQEHTGMITLKIGF